MPFYDDIAALIDGRLNRAHVNSRVARSDYNDLCGSPRRQADGCSCGENQETKSDADAFHPTFSGFPVP
jgi:hypothetical protein